MGILFQRLRRVAGRNWISVLVVGPLLLCLPRSSAAQVRVKAGVGTGLTYGSPFIGGGLEAQLGEHLGLLGGVGAFGAETPWAYGVRAYLQRSATQWRFHVSALHWTEGNGVYLGVDHDFGRSGGFVATYGVGFGDVNQEGNVHVMGGLGYLFGAATRKDPTSRGQRHKPSE
jgi:hypothetical protein